MRAIAALAMYDWPEVAAANDALWRFVVQRLHQAGIEAPAALDRTQSYSAPWLSPRLLLAQTCGYPYATGLRGKVRLVGTPCYSAPGCDGSNYNSVVIVRGDWANPTMSDLGEATAAVNSGHSQSGHWALRAAIAVTPEAVPPSRAVLSGSHRNSLRMVASGAADVAAVDAVCWALAGRYETEAVTQVRVIARTPSTPGLPLIAALNTPEETIEALRDAFAAAVVDPSLAAVRETLFLKGFEVLPDAAYDRVLALKREALTRPFPPLETC